MENFGDWTKLVGTDADGDPVIGAESCDDFKKELWFKLGKRIWCNHQYTFQDNVKYINNDMVKPFRVRILQYFEFIREMHEHDK